MTAADSPLAGSLVARGLMAMAALLFLSACPEGGEGADAGHDVMEVPIEIELGVRAEPEHGFAELPPDPTLEVVSGFQGGFHLEPALRIDEPGVEEFITVVEYTVTDVATGELYSNDPLSYRVRDRAWNHEPGVGYTRSWEQVLLNVADDDEIAGKTVRIDVRVVVEETHAVGTDSATFNIVNEINELR